MRKYGKSTHGTIVENFLKPFFLPLIPWEDRAKRSKLKQDIAESKKNLCPIHIYVVKVYKMSQDGCALFVPAFTNGFFDFLYTFSMTLYSLMNMRQFHIFFNI